MSGHSTNRSEKFLLINTGYTGEILMQKISTFIHTSSLSTAQVTYNGEAPTLFGGPLTGEYTLLQVQFRWGKNDFIGSEHSINGNL
jgi:Eukaryotic-type carbonic anhydrase